MPGRHSTFQTGLKEDIERFDLSAEAVRLLESDLEWTALYRQGRVADAYERLCRDTPLPEMSAHIRPDPDGEDDTPDRQLRYMVAWIAREQSLTGVQVPHDPTGFQVAVVGGGPAGLAGSVRLLEKGHTVHLIEREHKLGGAPALVYDEDRLPDPSEEIESRLAPAVESGRLTVSLGETVSAEVLLQRHDALLLAVGCWNEPSLGKGRGVWTALEFLKAVRNGRQLEIPKTAAILCGGDAAMDAAVVAKRLGVSQLHLLFDVPMESIYWHMPKAWFDTPGVEAHFDVHPTDFEEDAEGRVRGVIFKERDTMETEMVIEATGLRADPVSLEQDAVFAAGAVVNGGASVQLCMHEGFAAAEDIDRYLRGQSS